MSQGLAKAMSLFTLFSVFLEWSTQVTEMAKPLVSTKVECPRGGTKKQPCREQLQMEHGLLQTSSHHPQSLRPPSFHEMTRPSHQVLARSKEQWTQRVSVGRGKNKFTWALDDMESVSQSLMPLQTPSRARADIHIFVDATKRK